MIEAVKSFIVYRLSFIVYRLSAELFSKHNPNLKPELKLKLNNIFPGGLF